jgi:hypothetical protein
VRVKIFRGRMARDCGDRIMGWQTSRERKLVLKSRVCGRRQGSRDDWFVCQRASPIIVIGVQPCARVEVGGGWRFNRVGNGCLHVERDCAGRCGKMCVWTRLGNVGLYSGRIRFKIVLSCAVFQRVLQHVLMSYGIVYLPNGSRKLLVRLIMAGQ